MLLTRTGVTSFKLTAPPPASTYNMEVWAHCAALAKLSIVYITSMMMHLHRQMLLINNF